MARSLRGNILKRIHFDVMADGFEVSADGGQGAGVARRVEDLQMVALKKHTRFPSHGKVNPLSDTALQGPFQLSWRP
jgi:hypothetical protein